MNHDSSCAIMQTTAEGIECDCGGEFFEEKGSVTAEGMDQLRDIGDCVETSLFNDIGMIPIRRNDHLNHAPEVALDYSEVRRVAASTDPYVNRPPVTRHFGYAELQRNLLGYEQIRDDVIQGEIGRLMREALDATADAAAKIMFAHGRVETVTTYKDGNVTVQVRPPSAPTTDEVAS